MATEAERFEFARQEAFVKAYRELAEVAEEDLFEAILRNSKNVVVCVCVCDGPTWSTLYDLLVGYKYDISCMNALKLLRGKIVSVPVMCIGENRPMVKLEPKAHPPDEPFISLMTYHKLKEVAEICGVERVSSWEMHEKSVADARAYIAERAQKYAEERAAEKAMQ